MARRPSTFVALLALLVSVLVLVGVLGVGILVKVFIIKDFVVFVVQKKVHGVPASSGVVYSAGAGLTAAAAGGAAGAAGVGTAAGAAPGCVGNVVQ